MAAQGCCNQHCFCYLFIYLFSCRSKFSSSNQAFLKLPEVNLLLVMALDPLWTHRRWSEWMKTVFLSLLPLKQCPSFCSDCPLFSLFVWKKKKPPFVLWTQTKLTSQLRFLFCHSVALMDLFAEHCRLSVAVRFWLVGALQLFITWKVEERGWLATWPSQ